MSITLSGPIGLLEVKGFFSPDISPKTVTKPVVISPAIPTGTSTTTPVLTLIVTPTDESSRTRGKEVVGEPAQTKAPRKVVVESSKQEIEEILNNQKERL